MDTTAASRTSPDRWQAYLYWGVVFIGLASLYPLQVRLDATFSRNRAIEETLYVQSGETVRRLSFGFDGVVSDLYWIRTVQYFGRKLGGGLTGEGAVDFSKLSRDDMPLLEPLLNITTTVDPNFTAAYRTGAIFLAEFDYDAALALLRKGIAVQTDQKTLFRLWSDYGAICWRAKRYEECAEAYERASALAPSANDRDWTAVMVGAAKTRGGDRRTSYLLFQKLRDEAEHEGARLGAEWRLQQLTSLDERDFMERMIGRFRETYQRNPASFAELYPLLAAHRDEAYDTLGRPLELFHQDFERRFGRYDRAPLDPTGIPYRYDPVRGCVGLNATSSVARDLEERCP
jgi:tetratricopeptide (TPR) repeat protein